MAITVNTTNKAGISIDHREVPDDDLNYRSKHVAQSMLILNKTYTKSVFLLIEYIPYLFVLLTALAIG
jgi:hypothetical protein